MHLATRRASRRNVLMIFVLGLAALLPGGSTPRPARAAEAEAPGWKLVWADEFDGNAVRKKRWAVGNNKKPNYDGGVNYYDPANVWVEGGNLVMRSDYAGDDDDGNPLFSSGGVRMKGKFKYGRMEIRAKLPGTQGMWPAIWLLPRDGSWPPEIDIMEMLGHDPTVVYMTQHWGTRDERESSQDEYDGPDFTADFHTFAIEWEPGMIRWLVDGVERKVVRTEVPDKAMYLIMNTSVGGEWPEMPDETTVFPQFFLVDYVRVYRGVPAR